MIVAMVCPTNLMGLQKHAATWRSVHEQSRQRVKDGWFVHLHRHQCVQWFTKTEYRSIPTVTLVKRKAHHPLPTHRTPPAIIWSPT